MTRVAVIGIRGVPAMYGGFESLVENLIDTADVDYTIYCSSADMPGRNAVHKGSRLKYIPLRSNGAQSVLYDMWAMLRSLCGYDILLVLGVSGCLLLPVVRLLTRSRIIVNIDGLEHRRDKWGRVARWVLRTSEAMAVRFAHTVIADNQGIVDYVRDTYGKQARLIAYGGDHALLHSEPELPSLYDKYRKLLDSEYDITICRIEPENNNDKILEAYAITGRRMVMVGNWHHSRWADSLHARYCNMPNIVLLDSVYDINALYVLRSNARCYVHGHSAGGTNPSLVEAMFFGKPILAFDVVYNRATTYNEARYWANVDELCTLIVGYNHYGGGKMMRSLADEHYRWHTIRRQYEELY